MKQRIGRTLLAVLLLAGGLIGLGATVLPTAAQEVVTVQAVQNDSLGLILVDGAGNTLYRFTNDPPGVSNCVGACAGNWPPLLALMVPWWWWAKA